MAHQLFSRIGGSPLGRAGLASFSILAIVGVASQVLPLTCLSAGVSSCELGVGVEPALADTVEADQSAALGGTNPSSALRAPSPARGEGKTAGAGDTTKVAASSLGSVRVSPSGLPRTTALLEQPPLPTLTQNDLVAATFQALKVELTSAPADLTTRKVKTITINADGTPMFEAAPMVETQVADVGTASAAPTPGPSPQGGGVQKAGALDDWTEAGPIDQPQREIAAVEAPSAPMAASEPASREESSPVSAYAPAAGDSATVSGKGANVRSAPNKGKSDVLFALSGGAEVTVVQMSRGWAKVVDKQGRSGWIYGEYLDRG
ncbi:MAG: SH3 domain-containing protein [Devosia sp.]